MEVLKLLESRNRCLHRLLSHSETLLEHLQQGDLTLLESSQIYRDATLKALALYDRKITQIVQEMPTADRTDALKATVRLLQKTQDDLTQTILEVDQQVIQKIEEEKTRLTRELATADKSQQMLNKFKSSWIAESGAQLDEHL